MSAQDPNVELDLYGEEPQQSTEKQSMYAANPQTDRLQSRHDSNMQQSGDDEVDYGDEAIPDPEPKVSQLHENSQQGVKRKAETNGHDGEQDEQVTDPRPVDPDALPALILTELHWWTTEEDLREICAKAEAEEELADVAFGEQKINGKSKGEAYLEFYSVHASTAVKREIEAASQAKEEGSVRKSPFVAYYSEVGNPYYTPPSGGVKKDASQDSSRAGAYNSSFNNRGGFRGRGGYHRGGFNNNMRGSPQAGWGMNGGMGGGYGQNPMMGGFGTGGFGTGGFGLGGFGGMAQGGGMMNMMGGRGNFMNMGGNMMGGRGGGGGGWNNAGNFQGMGGGYNSGYYGAGQGNKRMRME